MLLVALGEEELREEPGGVGQAGSGEDELVTGYTEHVPCQRQDRHHSPEKPQDRDTGTCLLGRE